MNGLSLDRIDREYLKQKYEDISEKQSHFILKHFINININIIHIQYRLQVIYEATQH
jgi:hypothetical protein